LGVVKKEFIEKVIYELGFGDEQDSMNFFFKKVLSYPNLQQWHRLLLIIVSSKHFSKIVSTRGL
jgi:hypothetical protein